MWEVLGEGGRVSVGWWEVVWRGKAVSFPLVAINDRLSERLAPVEFLDRC